MEVRNCRKCGRIFNYVAGMPICPMCREKTEAKFQEVKEYIRANEGAGIPQISEECDVEDTQIHQWIREERLVFSDNSPVGINCENCGAMIKTGRFCDKCKAQMINGLNNSIRQKPVERPEKRDPRDNPKMRFLER